MITMAGALPTGVTFTDHGDGAASLSGTPAAGTGGTYPLTFAAARGGTTRATQNFALIVRELPPGPGGPGPSVPPVVDVVFTSANSATWSIGSAASFQVTTSSAPPAHAITLTGALPAGVTFTSQGDGTGTLAGTPPPGSAGTYQFVFTGINATGGAGAQIFTLTIQNGSTPIFTTPPSATFAVGAGGTFTVATAAEPRVTSLTITAGALPSGVVFADHGDGTATLSGTPAPGTPGTFALTLSATNGSSTATQSFTLTVNAPSGGLPAITSAHTIAFVAGSAAAFSVTTIGTPTPGTISVSGALPPGVTFTNNGNGTAALAGTAESGAEGLYPLTFTATNANGVATQSFTLNVHHATSTPMFTSATSSAFRIGLPGTFAIATVADPPVTTITLTGTPPPDVTFTDNGNGTATLSGAPTAGPGLHTLTFSASNGGAPVTQRFTLAVHQAAAITSANAATFTADVAGTFTMNTIGTPIPSLTHTGTLPSGVSFTDQGNGTATLAGTTAVGTFPLTVIATNGIGAAAQQSFTLNVSANNAPTLDPIADPASVNEDAGLQTVGVQGISAGAGESQPLQVTATSNNTALIPDPTVTHTSPGATGTLSYTPAANVSGSALITVTVRDGGHDLDLGTAGDNQTVTQAFTVTVLPVNDAPTFVRFVPGPIDVPEESGSTAAPNWAKFISAGPPDESGQTVTFNITGNSNPSLFAVAPDVSTTNGWLTFTTAPNAFGSATMTVTLSDNGGTANGGADTSAPETLVINVSNQNDTPSFAAGANQIVLEDALAQTIAGWATAISPGPNESDALTFNVSNNNMGLFSVQPAVAADGTLTYTLAPNQNGAATVSLSLTDDGMTPGTPGDNLTSATQQFTITATPVNDAPSFVKFGGDPVNVNEDGGSVAAPNWASPISAGPTPDEAGQTLTFNITGNTNPSLFTVPPAVDPVTGWLTFTLAPDAFGSTTVTMTLSDSGGIADDGADTSAPQTVVINVANVNDGPVVNNESFDLVGNTELLVDMAAGSTPHTSAATSGPTPVEGLLDNDTDIDSVLTVSAIGGGCADSSAPFDCTLADGAVVHVEANGAFSYTPAPGATTGTLSYTVSDGSASVGGTATFNVSEMVWYVRNDAPAGNGTSIAPLNAFTTLNGTGPDVGSDVDDANDYIFVFYGNGTANGQDLGLELEAGQHLIGEFNGLSIPVNLNGNSSPTIVVPQPSGTACDSGPCRPLITHPIDNLLTAANAVPAEIAGFRLLAGGNAIYLFTDVPLTGAPLLAIHHNVFEGAGADGIDVNLDSGTTGTLDLRIENNAWNPTGVHSGTGVDIEALAGTLNLAFNRNTDVVGDIGVNIFSGGGATTTITSFADNAIHGNTNSFGLAITGVTFDAVPGGIVQPVDGNTLRVGSFANPVADRAIFFQSLQGSLFFDDLDVFADNAGLTVFGVPGLSLGVAPAAPAGSGTSSITAFSALFLQNVTIDLRLQNLSCSPGGSCVALHDVAGVLRAAPGSTIVKVGGTVGPEDAAFLVDNSGAGTTVLTVLYEGALSNTSGVGHAVIVNNADIGSTISFTGPVTDATNFGNGVALTSNTGATISFTGGLSLATGVNAAFTAIGGGTITVVDPPGAPNNTITTTTGRALNVSNTNIGPTGLTFERISSGEPDGGGPVNGINLDTTGILGGLIVTGAGGTCTFASPNTCSGGTIQSSTGDAIRLVSTQDVSLTQMHIHDNDVNGIYGDELTNFSLANSVVTDNDVTNPGPLEAGIKFNELYGTASITNTVVLGTHGDNIRLEMASGTLTPTNFTLTNVTVGLTADLGGGVFGNGLSIITSGGGPTINATVGNSWFTGVNPTRQQASGILTAIGAGTTTLSVIASVFDQADIGINLSSTGTGIHRFNVDDNDLTLHRNNAIRLGGTSVMDGTVNNNRVGDGALDSGSELTSGISVIHSGNATWTLAVTNNSVRNTETEGIVVLTGAAPGDTGTVDLTVSNNTVFPPDDNNVPLNNPNGMWFRALQSTTLCANIANNESQGNGSGVGYRVEKGLTATFHLQGFVAGGVPATLAGNNNHTATGPPTVNTSGSGFTGCTATLPSFP